MRKPILLKPDNTPIVQYSDSWKPLIGLTALGDSDTVVREAYLSWYDLSVSKRPNDPTENNEVLGNGLWYSPAFATAVALLLAHDPGKRANYENRLNKELETMRETIETECKSDLFLYGKENNNLTIGETVVEANEVQGSVSWGYMATLALAWLYQLREGRNVFANIPNPSPSDLQRWRSPFVPGEAIRQAHTNRLPIPLSALRCDDFPNQNAGDIDLFYNPPPKPPDNSLGNVPRPPESVTTRVELTTGPLEFRRSQEISIPFPPFNVSGENQDDWVCVMAPPPVFIEEAGLRRLIPRWDPGRLVLEVTVERTIRREGWRPVIRRGVFRADYNLNWVKRP